MFDFLGQFSAFFANGVLAAALIGAGIILGWALARTRVSKGNSGHNDVESVLETLTQLLDWTRHVAEDMSEYRAVLSGVSTLFRNNDEPLDDQKRMATVGLLSQLVEANEQLQNRLNQAELMLQEQAGDISTYMSEARTDPLTGLPNRRALDESLSQRLCEWTRHGRPLSVLMIDIDHFKTFNDTYGHQVGDAVLKQVAELLKKAVRESDIVGRFGGEEMMVILPGTEVREACATAVRIRRDVIETPFINGGQPLQITVSVGTAQCLVGELAEGLIRRADEALYAAKEAGRNQAFWHDGHSAHRLEPAGEAEPAGKHEPREAGPQDANNPVAASAESSASPSNCAAASFAQVCEDLRERLEEVTNGFSRNTP
ncbi:MAG: GGDEF domain-containing protein [Pirellulaceae bacterium]